MEKGGLKLIQTVSQRIQALHAGKVIDALDRYQLFEIIELLDNKSAIGKMVRTPSEYFNLEGGKLYGTVLPFYKTAVIQSDANDSNG